MYDLNAQLEQAQQASRAMNTLTDIQRNDLLQSLADAMIDQTEALLAANAKDLARMDKNDPRYDRLQLTEKRIAAVADGLRHIATLASPLDIVLMNKTLESGIDLKKITVPLGVVGIIYEARPNVTFDVFAMAFKSGNSCVLKGGKDAADSNEAIVSLIKHVLKNAHINTDCVTLLPNDYEVVHHLFKAHEYVDVLIPRGSMKLIDFVRDNAKIPVIETGAGVVHIYCHHDADMNHAPEIIYNAKISRPSVCNSLDTLLLHRDRIADLPKLTQKLAEKNVEIYADEDSFTILSKSYPSELLHNATTDDFGREYLSLAMSIKIVDSLDDALTHIATFSSKHTEAILSEDQRVIDRFLHTVDAANVFANCSTRFSDGFEYGLGAEVGISTQKLHARGPMGIEALTTYKWVGVGDGQIR